MFEIIRTIYSNSERSETVTECVFFYFFLKVSQIMNYKIRIQIGKKILWFRNMQEKIENRF